MADTADLVVLGAYFGTGSKGGIMSTFLLGCRDSVGKWRTVCKASHTLVLLLTGEGWQWP